LIPKDPLNQYFLLDLDFQSVQWLQTDLSDLVGQAHHLRPASLEDLLDQ
jgi:hypothetical protein